MLNFKETSKPGVPDIYYIGLGKTGSASFLHAFPKHTVAHWHSLNYFERIHGKDSLKGYNNIYDYVFDLCFKHNVKPLVIECFRDIVAQKVSSYFQEYKNILHKDSTYNLIMSKLFTDEFKFQPHSPKLIPKYLTELKPYQETELGKFCILKFEEIESRRDFFQNIGYDYCPNHLNNKQSNPVYQKVLKNFKLDKNYLTKIYSDPIFQQFYSEKEINTFIKKWTA